MNWTQYWDLQWKNFEVGMVVYGVIFGLFALGFLGWFIYDKIQDWKGN